jgi:hypothetical protein
LSDGCSSSSFPHPKSGRLRSLEQILHDSASSHSHHSESQVRSHWSHLPPDRLSILAQLCCLLPLLRLDSHSRLLHYCLASSSAGHHRHCRLLLHPLALQTSSCSSLPQQQALFSVVSKAERERRLLRWRGRVSAFERAFRLPSELGRGERKKR